MVPTGILFDKYFSMEDSTNEVYWLNTSVYSNLFSFDSSNLSVININLVFYSKLTSMLSELTAVTLVKR